MDNNAITGISEVAELIMILLIGLIIDTAKFIIITFLVILVS